MTHISVSRNSNEAVKRPHTLLSPLAVLP
jgi:hypothetical protein